ncbi:MAG: TRL-like family protein [Deltaproteobacteria bacterium]|nr:TRL-like family protein [Deltaproteobacteria bacterium]
MKKRMLKSMILMGLAFPVLLAGCGAIYTNIKTPLPSLSVKPTAANKAKAGSSICSSYAWLVAVGDCSIEAAMNNGGISKVHHVDRQKQTYFFDVYTKDTVIVYGE